LQRGLTCLHFPVTSKKKPREHTKQLVELNFLQLGSENERTQTPLILVYPEKQVKQVPSVRLEALHKGLNGTHREYN
jgi:hypothetical protein